MSTHWGVVVADVVAGAALATAVTSILYARRADGRAKKADARADRAEQRIEAEESRNAVRWQLELSREPTKLWLRNVGTQDASRVSILDPGAPIAHTEEQVNWVPSGHAVAVRIRDPERTVTSLMVSWAQPNHGSANVPLPAEWLTVPAPRPQFTVESVGGIEYRLRNDGDIAALGVTADDDTGLARNLPAGVDLAPGQAHPFVILGVDEVAQTDTINVTLNGAVGPLHVPVPPARL